MNKNVEPNVLINISSLDVGNKKMLVKLQEYLRTIEGDNTIGFHIIESSKVIRLNLKVDKKRKSFYYLFKISIINGCADFISSISKLT